MLLLVIMQVSFNNILFLDDDKKKERKISSDVNYSGNALDIIHGLRSHKNGCKELQELVTLRSLSKDPVSTKTQESLSKNRYKHKRKFIILPISKNEKDYSTYMPHDKHSILAKKSIMVKVRNDPYDLPKYD